MISTFSLLSGKPKKAICGVFCGRSIFNPLRFSPNKELVKNFVAIWQLRSVRVPRDSNFK